MIVRAIITVPPGQAQKSSAALRNFLLVGTRYDVKSYVNLDDSQIIWEITAPMRTIFGIQKRLTMYEIMTRQAINSFPIKKFIKRYAAPGEAQKLEKLMLEDTKIEVVKAATANEIVDATTTRWEKIKKAFRLVG